MKSPNEVVGNARLVRLPKPRPALRAVPVLTWEEVATMELPVNVAAILARRRQNRLTANERKERKWTEGS